MTSLARGKTLGRGGLSKRREILGGGKVGIKNARRGLIKEVPRKEISRLEFRGKKDSKEKSSGQRLRKRDSLEGKTSSRAARTEISLEEKSGLV